MDLVRELISIGRNIRESKKIKVREPLARVYLDGKKESLITDLTPLIKEELNVKEVVFINDLSEYLNFQVKPNFKEVGKIFGSKIKDFQSALANITSAEVASLENNEEVSITLGNELVTVTKNMVDIRVEAKDDMAVEVLNNNFVILDIKRDESLINEGIAREFVSKIQNLRKEKDYEITDRINIYYDGSENFIDIVKQFNDYIMKETLAKEITIKNNLTTVYDLNGESVKFDIEKA